MLEPIHYMMAIGGGFFAGMMNALAGFGSVITLSLFMDVFGLSPNMANGTNRVNILAMSSTSSYLFYKKGKLDLNRGKWYLFIMVIGALFGVWIAISISNEQFKAVFKYLLLGIFIMLLLNPKKMLREKSEKDYIMPIYLMIPVFLFLGVYNGFIQMGGGLMFLLAIVILGRYNLIEGNAIKLAIVTCQTLVVITIFHLQGLVNWQIGGIVAIGQVAGGLVAVNYSTKWPKANIYAYWLLIAIVFVMLLKYFGIINF